MNTEGSIEILTKAKELISDPKRWSQGKMARNRKGELVRSTAPTAVRWCALGAINHFTIDLNFSRMKRHREVAVDLLCSVIGITRINRWNDDPNPYINRWNDDPKRTHEEVMDAFDQAIILAQRREELYISTPEIAAHEDRDP